MTSYNYINYKNLTSIMDSTKYVFVGWAAVSSRKQAGDEKVSLSHQLSENIMHARRYGALLCQLVVPGRSRSIPLFEDAEKLVTGYRIDEDFGNLTGDKLLKEIESHLRALRESDEIYPYAELKKLIVNQSFNVFSFFNLGRVGRDAALSMTIMSLCNHADIITYATSTPPSSITDANSSYHKSLLDAITAVSYENEVREIGTKHKTGMIRRIEGGKFPGITPYGWNEVRDGRGHISGYEIDETAARVVRHIVRLFLDEGLGQEAIAAWLNNAGYSAPAGGTWRKYSVQAILQRIVRYAGVNEINKLSKKRPHVQAPGSWPAIISEEQARAVIDERQRRIPSRRSVAFAARFSRMVYCVTCGKQMHVHRIRSKYTTVGGENKVGAYCQYRCMEHGAVSESKVMQYVEAAIAEAERLLDEFDGREEPPPPQPTTTEKEIVAIEEQIERVKAGVDRADIDHYIHASMSAERHRAIAEAAEKRMAELLQALNRLTEQKHIESQAEHRQERIEDVANVGYAMLHDANERKANAWLRRHFRVHASGGTVEHVEII